MNTLVDFAGAGKKQALPTPRLMQAALLLSTSSFAVMVTAVLGPSIPQMQDHFAGTANVQYLVPLAVTIPMFMMAILSMFAGAASDKFGRKHMLAGAMLCYAFVGTAPMWLDSLPHIIESRLLLGALDAIIMTCSTTMIGDYYTGLKRQQMLTWATTVSSISAVALTGVGAYLGHFGWRAPYAVYGAALIIAPLMVLYLWESIPAREAIVAVAVTPVTVPSVTFRPRLLAIICAIGLCVGIVFILVPIHLAFMLGAIGANGAQAIGVAASLTALSVAFGTLGFGWIIAKRFRELNQLGWGVALAGLGFLWIANAATYNSLTAGAMLNGFGCGILLPALSTWNMRELPPERRGFGTGAFMSSVFLGMSINPLVVIFIAEHTSGRAGAVGFIGWVMVASAAILVYLAITPQARGRKPLERA